MTSLLSMLRAADGDPLRRYVSGIPGMGGMSPMQRAFHRDTARKRILRAANGTGKSFSGAAEAWMHLMRRHPSRDVPDITGEYWVLCPDIKQGWKVISKNLRQLEPAGGLDPSCQYVEGVGYTYRSRKILRTSTGRLLVGHGCVQPVISLEGDRIDGLWIDEPPKREHFEACRARVNRTMGPIWLTLTPIGRPVGWLRELVDGVPEEGKPPVEMDWWGSGVGWHLTAENAPHLTADTLAAMREVDPWESAQRLRAEWEGYTVERRFRHFTEALIVYDDDIPRYDLDSGDELRLGFDHGEGDQNQICYVVLVKGVHTSMPRFYILGECVPPSAGATADDVALSVLTELSAWDIHPRSIGAAFGDANSAGLLGGGIKYNTYLERAFGDLLRDQRGGDAPFAIRIPAKRAGSVKAGESGMNAAMKEGRFFVHHTCRRLIHSLRHYTTQQERDLKNAVDACRYAILDKLLAWREPMRPTLRRS